MSVGRTAAHPPGSRGRRSARPAAVAALWTRTPRGQYRRCPAGIARRDGPAALPPASRRRRSLAFELRAIERQDDGLRRFASLVSKIEGRMTTWYGIATGGTVETVAHASTEASDFGMRLATLNEHMRSPGECGMTPYATVSAVAPPITPGHRLVGFRHPF